MSFAAGVDLVCFLLWLRQSSLKKGAVVSQELLGPVTHRNHSSLNCNESNKNQDSQCPAH